MKNKLRTVFIVVLMLFVSAIIVVFQKPFTRKPYDIQYAEYPNQIVGTQGFPIITEEYICENDKCFSTREKYFIVDYVKLEYINIGFYFIILSIIVTFLYRKKLFK